ncbi:MAG: sigma-54-dependent Fis family transcriptional regulator [Deltaproteobacteria bacterium]|nr:MAG: sigma-54-dependent Fis family transcriptional regulator [Deltaproteobacteria bacterium]
MPPAKLLIVSSDKSFRQVLRDILANEDFSVLEADSGKKAIRMLSEFDFEGAFCDLNLSDLPGKKMLEELQSLSPDTSFLIVNATNLIDSSLEAVRREAQAHFSRRKRKEGLFHTIEEALERSRGSGGSKQGGDKKEIEDEFPEIIGRSKAITDILDIIKKVAGSKSTVLLTGSSGTGKELFAKAIHCHSPRKDKPFVVVNCGAIPEHLLESELFGHKKGAFTNAVSSKKGLFQEANEGTLFLDEIGELPFELQPKILRAIEEEEIRSVGSNELIKLNLRILAATNKDLEEEVKNGKFREDLFYRLNVFPIHIPPLKARGEDVRIIAEHFVQKYASESSKDIQGISPNALAMLKNYPWPGNVRELENAIEQAVLLHDGDGYLEEADLPLFLEKREAERKKRFVKEALDKRLSIEEYTREFIKRFESEYSEKKLAQLLGINSKTLWEKRQRWNLPRGKKQPA